MKKNSLWFSKQHIMPISAWNLSKHPFKKMNTKCNLTMHHCDLAWMYISSIRWTQRVILQAMDHTNFILKYFEHPLKKMKNVVWLAMGYNEFSLKSIK
jgi:hypothetical protein